MKIRVLFIGFYIFLFLFISNCNAGNNAVKNSNKNNKNNYKHFGIIISGPSGVGKTTLINELVKKYPETLVASVSATTRPPRNYEKNGKDYYFLDKAKFQELVDKDEFIEFAKNYNNYYGSPRRNYIEAVENNKDPIFSLSYEGMKNAKKKKKMDFITIFVSVINEKELFNRLKNRKTDTEEQINLRFKSAKEEMKNAEDYDYIVYNTDVKKAVKNIEAIYLAEQRKREV